MLMILVLGICIGLTIQWYFDYSFSEWSELRKRDKNVRELLWLNHGHETMSGLYGDDGEMQCSRCLIDFKREPLEDIIRRINKLKKILKK